MKKNSMKLSNFIEGLKTLQPYYKDVDGSHIDSEHVQFFAYQTERPLTPEDVQKMRDLGWFQPRQEDDAEYDQEDGWSAFT